MPEEYERIKREFGAAGHSLLLDLQERITALETMDKFAEAQRTEILRTVTELRDELHRGNLEMLTRDVRELRERELMELKKRIATLEIALNQATGGAIALKIFWIVVGSIIGAAGTVVTMLTQWRTK